jgi:ABC-type nitrate/sulfonate/bicarbonate transport system substrate-binding protein
MTSAADLVTRSSNKRLFGIQASLSSRRERHLIMKNRVIHPSLARCHRDSSAAAKAIELPDQLLDFVRHPALYCRPFQAKGEARIMKTDTSKFRPRRFAATFFSLLVLSHALAGQVFAQDARRIRIGYSALSLSFLPHLFARDAGVFKKRGLTVELIQMAGPIQIAALASGEIDFGAAVSPALFAAVRGLPIRGVMIAVKTPLFYIVSEPGTKRLEDLAGKKVAVDTVGALQYIAARTILKKKGVNPDQISYIQTGSVSNSVAALNSGAVNAALLSLPNNVIMTQKGFNELSSTVEAGVNFPPGGLTVHAHKLQKDSAQIKRTIEAVLDSLALIETDSRAVTGYIQRQWKLSPQLAEETRRLAASTLVATGKMSFEEVQEFLDTAYENGQIQQKANSKVLMDYGPLEEVLKTRRPK